MQPVRQCAIYLRHDMKHTEDHPEAVKNVDGYFYVIGAVFGALMGGFAQESLSGTLIGLVVGLIFAAFFVKVLLPERAHDR